MSLPVVVVGDAVLDVRAAPDAPLRRGADVPARIDLLPGGQGANVAVRLARRGVEVVLVAAIAQDAAGRLVRSSLESDGVRLRPLDIDATGAVVVLAETDGDRTMLSQRREFAGLVDAASVPAAAWTVLSGYLLHEPAAATLCAELSRRDGRRVLLGCAVPDELLGSWRASAEAYRPELVVLNRSEASRLAVPSGSGTVVTDASGATASIGGVTVTSTTGTVTPALDTTGAGDALSAALVAELDGAAWPPPRDVLQDALEAGVALASRVSRVRGAQGRVSGERPAVVPA